MRGKGKRPLLLMTRALLSCLTRYSHLDISLHIFLKPFGLWPLLFLSACACFLLCPRKLVIIVIYVQCAFYIIIIMYKLDI
jgi:hypothetical protein